MILSHENLLGLLRADAENPLVAGDLGFGAHGLVGIVRQLDRRTSVGAHRLADQRKGRQPVVRGQTPEIIGQQRAPAERHPHPAAELVVQLEDLVLVQPVREDHQLLARVLAALLPPADRGFRAGGRVAAVDADAGPLGQPIGRAVEKSVTAIGVRQDDAQVAVMLFVPIGQHVIGRTRQRRVGIGQRGIDHGQFMGVGADRL